MRTEHPVVLLVGSDPDVSLLRSAVLASAGIWSLRVNTADQAIALLARVPCDLVLICYTLDDENQQQLSDFLLSTHSDAIALWIDPGDDCSGTGFLMKVEDGLDDGPHTSLSRDDFQLATSFG